MRLIIFIAIIGWIVSSCNPEPTIISSGYYHFNDETNSKEISTRTLRLDQDSTFKLWGFRKSKPYGVNTTLLSDSIEFLIYITWGHWIVDEHYLILTTPDDILETTPKVLNDDEYFNTLRKWNYGEAVIKFIKNDTFLIQDNGKKLKEINGGLTLEHIMLQ